jgi:predicted membrane protein
MNKRWLIILLGILGIVMVFEILSNSFSTFMLILGVLALLFKNRVDPKNQNTVLVMGIGALVFALFSSRVVLLFLVVVLMLLIGEFPELFKTIRDAITKKKENGKGNEFVMVQFSENEQDTAEVVRNRWFGDDMESTEEIYSWQDLNFTKLMGDSIFDLGNTILPKEQNIIMIRKGFGNTKILVPEGIGISLDISMLLGELRINQEEIILKNETFKWHSDAYTKNARKIKLVANVLVGEVEVVFL